MRVLNKQKLEKDIRALFRTVNAGQGTQVNEEKFIIELSRLLEENELRSPIQGTSSMSVMIADLRGFTYMLEKFRSDDIINILNEFFARMVSIIDTHGGQINKFMGDFIIAYFDTGEDPQASVLNVLHCAIEMQLAMDAVNVISARMGLDSLYIGIGIDTGDVVASVLGSDIYREFTMIGSTVNLASRIEAYTLRGQILMSENTWKHVANLVETGQVNEVGAKGMSKPLRFYELMAINTPQRIALPKRDNRKAPRIKVSIPVYFQLLDGKNILPEVYEREVVDISYGGMLFVTPKAIEKFADLKVSIGLSPYANDPVDIYGKALYVQIMDKGVEIGLEFTIIDDATSANVKKFVDSLI